MHCGYPCLSQPPRQPLPHPTPLQQHTQRSLPYLCRTVPNHTPHPTLTQPFVIEPHPFPPGSSRVQQSLKNYGYCEIPVATSTYYVLRYTYLPRLYPPPRNKLSLSQHVCECVCVRACLAACVLVLSAAGCVFPNIPGLVLQLARSREIYYAQCATRQLRLAQRSFSGVAVRF